MRIWAPGKNSWGPGLALSRAFGDKAARRYGLISTPEVSQIKLTSDEEFIVIGSDGLFDFFEDQDICRFVRKLLKDGKITRDQISNELVNEARSKWPSDSDDISCIIIFM
jgi:serine/threonine protein phosphatase PrpC